jgi:hypothetical protein
MPVVDSKQQMLEVPEIVQVAVEESKEPVPFDIAYASVIKEFQDPNGTFLRYGNTIFIIHGSQKTPGTGIFRALNADTAKNFLESSYKFIDAAYRKGYWLLVTQFRDQSLLNIFRVISQNPPRPGMGYAVERLKDGQFQVNLTLGPKTNNEEAPPNMQMQQMQQPQGGAMKPQGALQQMAAPTNMMGGV